MLQSLLHHLKSTGYAIDGLSLSTFAVNPDSASLLAVQRDCRRALQIVQFNRFVDSSHASYNVFDPKTVVPYSIHIAAAFGHTQLSRNAAMQYMSNTKL